MTKHPESTVITRYAEGDPSLDEASVWSVEAHLETCPDCRARLASRTTDDTRALLDLVATGIDQGIGAGPAPVRRRRAWSVTGRRWFTVTVVPWLIMTAAVLGCAVLMQMAQPRLPSLVLLLAPVAPLPGVAVAWSRRSDPAWELIAGTPAAGLAMLLRRTAVVLAVVMPLLALAGTRTGIPLAALLAPCLAFTAATIALGSLIGVSRAAAALATLWAAAVVLPSLVTAELPAVLTPGGTGGWALVTVAMAAFIVARADLFRRLPSGH
ncbi:zf-HC2 domain-containing protein [Actinoplanes derwentensis]|uniref:Putative zinc-finger n=1 Tax=Actinoplanes derwentensis TaxID=113562 RepID=A0A1H1ZK46_9ACTN|nr:zf-HC2 domain-containing protein [Actinoplanes derwentensis]GID82477.1 membrane protein [Actinoplanes derwentensis]SDT33947.1 Putative zinc-finger [Actinoplanes derwentensis]